MSAKDYYNNQPQQNQYAPPQGPPQGYAPQQQQGYYPPQQPQQSYQQQGQYQQQQYQPQQQPVYVQQPQKSGMGAGQGCCIGLLACCALEELCMCL